MKTQDLFRFNRSADRINESIEKTFGQRLNLESFDLPKLEDARNKLRTQIHDARNQSGFNENLENETLTKAQWMLDTINAEIAEREEFVSDAGLAEIQDAGSMQQRVTQLLKQFEEEAMEMGAYGDPDMDKIIKLLDQGNAKGAADEVYGSFTDQDGDEMQQLEPMVDDLEADFEALAADAGDDQGGETDDDYAMKSAGFGSDEDYESIQTELSTNTLKSYQDKAGKDIVNTMTSGDYMTTDKSTKKVMNRMKGSERANSKIDKKNESMQSTQGEDMSNVTEGEVQQASAIVTAKTMVDRVGRWIEELSGMENDTLLQLGDSIRDEMSQEQAKTFISAVAPAIQQALENLKTTRETLATGVRTLTGEEQGAEMLGGEPSSDAGADEMAPAEPDAMNAGGEQLGDEFAAAEPAAGVGDAGREQRESIDRSSTLLRLLAG